MGVSPPTPHVVSWHLTCRMRRKDREEVARVAAGDIWGSCGFEAGTVSPRAAQKGQRGGLQPLRTQWFQGVGSEVARRRWQGGMVNSERGVRNRAEGQAL